MIPPVIVDLPALPLTANGKLDRQALPPPKAPSVEAAEGMAKPETLLEQRLVELWRHCLGMDAVTPEDNFFGLGGHSLLAARLILDVGNLIGKPVPMTLLFHAPTPRRLAQVLTDQGLQPPWSSLVPLQPAGTLAPLFFIHGWGGGVWDFRELSSQLGLDQPAYGLQAVGIEDKHWRHASVEEMAVHYAAEIRSFQPHGPYYLTGHSLGGMIAYEVARRLESQGQSIGVLIIGDTYVPNLPQLPYASAIAEHMIHLGERFWHHLRRVCSKDRVEIPKYLLGRIKACKWHASQLLALRPKTATSSATAGSVSPPDVDHFYAAFLRYCAVPSQMPVTVLLAQGSRIRLKKHWRQLARGPLEFVGVKGDHLEFLESPNTTSLAHEYRRILAQARSQNGAHSAESRSLSKPGSG